MYKCAICKTEHNDLNDYMKCVASCGAALKQREEAEKKRKRLEEVNAALSKVKAAKAYYQEQLDIFKEKYPEEYKLNFFNEGVNECPYDCKGFAKDEDFDTDKNMDKPLDLFNDPEVRYIAKLLGILN